MPRPWWASSTTNATSARAPRSEPLVPSDRRSGRRRAPRRAPPGRGGRRWRSGADPAPGSAGRARSTAGTRVRSESREWRATIAVRVLRPDRSVDVRSVRAVRPSTRVRPFPVLPGSHRRVSVSVTGVSPADRQGRARAAGTRPGGSRRWPGRAGRVAVGLPRLPGGLGAVAHERGHAHAGAALRRERPPGVRGRRCPARSGLRSGSRAGGSRPAARTGPARTRRRRTRPTAAAELVRQRVQRQRRQRAGRRRSAPGRRGGPAVGVAAALGDQHLRPNARSTAGRPHGRRAASPRRRCRAGSATLTALPSAPAPPISSGSPSRGRARAATRAG